ncbi:uncharacterized protein LOC135389803 [Ornithodoros turicata]|uniref:uncharacterized protein LOC135389803 n=1 Tax=Ornithodoros turicata TaxID=34597 RepID=UPI003138DAD9
MAMRRCAILAAVLTLVAGKGFDFPGVQDRLKGNHLPYETQHRPEAYPVYRRPVVPSRQLIGLATQSNGTGFENRLLATNHLNGVVAAQTSNASALSHGDALKVPAVPSHSNFFERNPSFGSILDAPPASGHPVDEGPKHPLEMDPELTGKLHRRKLRMRHHKGLKEHKSRRMEKLMEDNVGDLTALDVRRHPETQRSEATGSQAGLQGLQGAGLQAAAAQPGHLDVSHLEPGHIDSNRLESLPGLKVEYARAYIAAEEPEADSGPMELLCTVGFREYASITWTVNGRPLENYIDRSTTTTVKNDIPVKVSKIVIDQLERLPSENGKFIFECTALVDSQVTKATIALGSIIEDTCTSNAQCEARGALCSEGRCVCKPSQPVTLKSKHLTCRAASNLGWPCHYSEQCVFAQPNSVCTDRLTCDCSLGFVRSLDGKTCDKLTAAQNLLGTPCKGDADCHAVGAVCVNSLCACANDTMEKGSMCLPLGNLKLEARELGMYRGALTVNGSMPNPALVAETTSSTLQLPSGAASVSAKFFVLLGAVTFALHR